MRLMHLCKNWLGSASIFQHVWSLWQGDHATLHQSNSVCHTVRGDCWLAGRLNLACLRDTLGAAERCCVSRRGFR